MFAKFFGDVLSNQNVVHASNFVKDIEIEFKKSKSYLESCSLYHNLLKHNTGTLYHKYNWIKINNNSNSYDFKYKNASLRTNFQFATYTLQILNTNNVTEQSTTSYNSYDSGSTINSTRLYNIEKYLLDMSSRRKDKDIQMLDSLKADEFLLIRRKKFKISRYSYNPINEKKEWEANRIKEEKLINEIIKPKLYSDFKFKADKKIVNDFTAISSHVLKITGTTVYSSYNFNRNLNPSGYRYNKNDKLLYLSRSDTAVKNDSTNKIEVIYYPVPSMVGYSISTEAINNLSIVRNKDTSIFFIVVNEKLVKKLSENYMSYADYIKDKIEPALNKIGINILQKKIINLFERKRYDKLELKYSSTYKKYKASLKLLDAFELKKAEQLHDNINPEKILDISKTQNYISDYNAIAQIEKEYPLLNTISSYSIDESKDDINFYIKLMDEYNEKNKQVKLKKEKII
jgi:hypothetical protein